MSEVNPLGGGWGKEGRNSYTTIKAQAKHWYDIELNCDKNDFVGCALELSAKCKYFILRDWSFVNFAPHAYNQNLPSFSFLTLNSLKGKCVLKPFAIVRNAVDVYLSRKGLLSEFVTSYCAYVNEIVNNNIPIYKYENFCDDPEYVLRMLCEYLNIPFDIICLNYQKFTNVNGDVQSVSRGQLQNKIAPLARMKVQDGRVFDAISRQLALKKANSLLGYKWL